MIILLITPIVLIILILIIQILTVLIVLIVLIMKKFPTIKKLRRIFQVKGYHHLISLFRRHNNHCIQQQIGVCIRSEAVAPFICT